MKLKVSRDVKIKPGSDRDPDPIVNSGIRIQIELNDPDQSYMDQAQFSGLQLIWIRIQIELNDPDLRP